MTRQAALQKACMRTRQHSLTESLKPQTLNNIQRENTHINRSYDNHTKKQQKQILGLPYEHGPLLTMLAITKPHDISRCYTPLSASHDHHIPIQQS